MFFQLCFRECVLIIIISYYVHQFTVPPLYLCIKLSKPTIKGKRSASKIRFSSCGSTSNLAWSEALAYLFWNNIYNLVVH